MRFFGAAKWVGLKQPAHHPIPESPPLESHLVEKISIWPRTTALSHRGQVQVKPALLFRFLLYCCNWSCGGFSEPCLMPETISHCRGFRDRLCAIPSRAKPCCSWGSGPALPSFRPCHFCNRLLLASHCCWLLGSIPALHTFQAG